MFSLLAQSDSELRGGANARISREAKASQPGRALSLAGVSSSAATPTLHADASVETHGN
jgi:hypothetical protein